MAFKPLHAVSKSAGQSVGNLSSMNTQYTVTHRISVMHFSYIQPFISPSARPYS